MAFQRSAQLDADGIVGPGTWQTLLARPDRAGGAPRPIPTALGQHHAGGLLQKAFDENRTEALTWSRVLVGDLEIEVASDAMTAPVGDRAGVRLPVTYAETVAISKALGCVTPTEPIARAMFAQAAARLHLVALRRTAADDRRMGTLEFVLRFHDAVEAEIAAFGSPPGALAFGAWKLWILHPRLAERGAVNHGFWSKRGEPVQNVGGRHDAHHYDYSQLFQPVKRLAFDRKANREIDLLDHMEKVDRVPRRFLDPYR